MSLIEFSSKLFGVTLQEQSQDETLKTIKALQDQLVEAMSKLSTKTNTDNFIIKTEHLESTRYAYPFVTMLNLNQSTFDGGNPPNSTVSFNNIPMRAYYGNRLDALSNLAVFFSSLPYMEFTMRFKPGRLDFMPGQHYLMSLNSAGYKHAMEYSEAPEHPIMIQPYRLRRSDGVLKSIKFEEPLATLQSVAPTTGAMNEALQSALHPHTNTTGGAFSSMCVGNNPFRDMWVNHRIKNINDFMQFIDGSAFWVSHMNVDDCYSSNAFPETFGATDLSIVRTEVFDICLDIINDLSAPLLEAFKLNIDDPDVYRSGSAQGNNLCIVPDAYMNNMRVNGATFANYALDLRNSLEHINPWVTVGRCSRARTYLPPNTPDGSLPMVDTCLIALLTQLNQVAEYDFDGDTQLIWQAMMRLREMAYTIVLLKLAVQPRFIEQVQRPDGVIMSHLCRANMKNMLKNNILIGINHAELASLGKAYFTDYGYLKGQLTRERILAPRVFLEALKYNANSREFPAWFSKLGMRGITDADMF